MFILKGFVTRTKDIIKPLEIVLLSTLFIGIVICVKFKPVYAVTISGKTLGYITEKSDLENRINEYMNHKEGNVAKIEIETMPKYAFELISRDTNTLENEILEKVTENAVRTYRTYAVTVNGDSIVEVNTETEANEVVEQLRLDLKEGVEFNLEISEVYSKEENSVQKDKAYEELNAIKLAKTQEYEAEQARLEAERIAAEQEAKRQASIRAQRALLASANAVASSGSGNIGSLGIRTPLRTSPLITSRFGASSRSRSTVHTGLDLATSMGTPIYPIAGGTVTFAGMQGSYGYMVIVDHGDGIQSWYAHCNSLCVGVGNQVTSDTLIATVGSTGNSTCPHLHLEIRVNGTAVNPQNYIY